MKNNQLPKDEPRSPSWVDRLPLLTAQCHPHIDYREEHCQTDREVTEYIGNHFHPKEFT